MAVDVTGTIQRPRDQVAAYLRDPANDTEWIGGIRSARLLTPGPVAVGSQVERVATFLGRRVHYVELFERSLEAQVVLEQPPRRLEVPVAQSLLVRGDHVVDHAHASSSRGSHDVPGEPGGRMTEPPEELAERPRPVATSRRSSSAEIIEQQANLAGGPETGRRPVSGGWR